MGGNWQGDHKPDLFLNYNIEANPFSRLLQIGEPYTHYFDSLKDRWLQLAQTTLSESAIAARLDSYVGQFEASGAWKREYSRWNNNPVPLTPILAEEIDYVKTWYHRSFAKLEATFGNASGIEQALGETPGATVRYNLAGQRVGLDYKGLVIDGRKKIFIK